MVRSEDIMLSEKVSCRKDAEGQSGTFQCRDSEISHLGHIL